MFITHLPTVFDPGIRPSNDGLPPGLTRWLTDIGSGIAGAAYIVLGIAFILAAVMWAFGKFGNGGSRMQTGGAVAVLIILGVAFLIAAGPSFISFFGNAGSNV